MKKVIRCICLISLVFFSAIYSVVSVHANSAQTRWSGTDSTRAIIVDEDCPIIVEKELLTFDLSEFPESYYRDVNDFLAYTGKVTAEYTFYNPSDYTVTATLVFPFGGIADYGDIYDFELDKRFINADTQKFDITIDGQIIDKQLRHTLMYYAHQFDLKQDLEKLHDGFMVVMEVLDGILHGDDVVVHGVVDDVDEGGQRGGLTGAGGAGDQNQSALFFAHLHHGGGHAQLVGIGDPLVQHADGDGQIALLPEHVETVAAGAGNGVGEVHFTAARQDLPVGLAHDGHGHGLRVDGGAFLIAQGAQPAVDAAHGRHTYGDMDIRRPAADAGFNQLVKGKHTVRSFWCQFSKETFSISSTVVMPSST